jgi:hypothetical protein
MNSIKALFVYPWATDSGQHNRCTTSQASDGRHSRRNLTVTIFIQEKNKETWFALYNPQRIFTNGDISPHLLHRSP